MPSPEKEEEEAEEPIIKPVKLKKNPTVETDFLPDRDREKEEAELREKLKKASGSGCSEFC